MALDLSRDPEAVLRDAQERRSNAVTSSTPDSQGVCHPLASLPASSYPAPPFCASVASDELVPLGLALDAEAVLCQLHEEVAEVPSTSARMLLPLPPGPPDGAALVVELFGERAASALCNTALGSIGAGSATSGRQPLGTIEEDEGN